MSKIPRISVHCFKEQEENIKKVIFNTELVYGNSLEIFSGKIKRIFNKKYCELTNSGNSALLLSLKALKLNGKNILIPAISTCFAIENAVLTS